MQKVDEATLGRCDFKQYEHCGAHEQIPDVGQRLPPFGCKNWKVDEEQNLGVPSSESLKTSELNAAPVHQPTCQWQQTAAEQCAYRQTHYYCPHPEHACSCELSPRPALAVRHCGDTYKACCLPWGWCHCICGDCRVAKYATAGLQEPVL